MSDYPRVEGTLLDVHGLRVETATGTPIVEEVSLRLNPGQTLGLVGESGSGKTTTALALLGFATDGAKITGGEIRVNGQLVDPTDERASRARRGRLISYVPQNPGTALNPSLRIGEAIREMVRAHNRGSNASEEVTKALAAVHLSTDVDFRRRYPHQLSGGQQQRVCIGIALASGPPLVVLDEPTTGLDAVTQARILEELERLRDENGLSMVYVSHDLAVIAQLVDRVAVMYAGRIVEEGPVDEVLRNPRHPYTRGLIASIPDHVDPREIEAMPGVAVGVGDRPTGCRFAPRCPLRVDECDLAVPPALEVGPEHAVRCIRPGHVPPIDRPRVAVGAGPDLAMAGTPILEVSDISITYKGRHETVTAADRVSFTLDRGECVGLVGESGSGKSSLVRAIAGLTQPNGGKIQLDGESLAGTALRRSVDQRRRLQLVFQNPADALNPRMTIGDAIGRPMHVLRGMRKAAIDQEIQRLLHEVRLPASVAARYPTELSGGERQRVGIARALAARPDVLICDEVTSALDVSVQAAVLSLLTDLRRELGLAVLFITHDLGVVATVADRVVVLERGTVRETGSVSDVLNRPQDPYTRRLVASAPSITEALAGLTA